MSLIAFVDHGSPLQAQKGGAWGSQLEQLGKAHPNLKGWVVVSAHWEEALGLRVGAGERPKTIHDFYGFPQELYRIQYPAPGRPELSQALVEALEDAGLDAALDAERGLDHGVWVPLRYLAPEAHLPVVPLSLPKARSPQYLMDVGASISSIIRSGYGLLCSGGLVHNIPLFLSGKARDVWAELLAFDAWAVRSLTSSAPHDSHPLLEAPAHPAYGWAVPTSEHFDPVWVALGAAGSGATVKALDSLALGEELGLHVLQFEPA